MADPYRFFLGVDLGSDRHQVYLSDDHGQTLGQREVEHGGTGMSELLHWLSEITHAADPSTLAAAVEAPRGALVDALLERGYRVYSINPKQLDRFRDRFSMAGAKDDRRDARVLAQSLRTDLLLFRSLAPDDPRLLRLRELSRAESGLQEDARRAANQLWSYLQRYFPALLELSPAADELWLFDLLERTEALPHRAARLRTPHIQALLDRHHIRRFSAADLQRRLKQPLPLAPGVDRALAEPVLLLLPRLKLLHGQRADLARRVEQVLEELSQDENFAERRSVEILRSIPGLGRVFTATALAEAFTPLVHRDYHALRALAGVAPVTEQSGKTRLVSMRRACNRRLRNAVFHAALGYMQHDPRARQLYARARHRGHNHARALRGLADRLLELICLLLRGQVRYDPARRGVAPAAA